jgi:hypothetical protein
MKSNGFGLENQPWGVVALITRHPCTRKVGTSFADKFRPKASEFVSFPYEKKNIIYLFYSVISLRLLSVATAVFIILERLHAFWENEPSDFHFAVNSIMEYINWNLILNFIEGRVDINYQHILIKLCLI